MKFVVVATFAISTIFLGCTQQKKQEQKTVDMPVTTQSNDARASFKQGLAMSDLADRTKAKALFSKAIEQDPKLGIAYVMRAVNDNSPKDFTDDMSKAKENMGGASKWEQWYCNYQETFLTSDWNKRMEIAKTMADSFPDAARTQVDLGNVYSQGNDEEKAKACYQKAINLDSSWVGGYASMTNSYLFLEPRDFQKAEGYATKVVALAPSSPGAEIALGDCYRAENDLAKARDAYAKAVTLDPNSPEAYYKEGHANTFLGNYDDARKNYADGGTHDANMTAANEYIGLTYSYAGDQKAASNIFMTFAMKADSSKGSKDDIDNAKLTYMTDCQRIAMQSGDAAEVKNCVAITDPLNMDLANSIGTQEAKLATQAQSLYWQAIMSSMNGKYDEAKASAEQMKTTLDPITDPNKLDQYHFAMGYISYQQKNYGEALSHFGMSHPENSVYTKYWLAKANEGAGNKDKAEALYKEVAVLNFNSIDYALVRNEVVNRKPMM